MSRSACIWIKISWAQITPLLQMSSSQLFTLWSCFFSSPKEAAFCTLKVKVMSLALMKWSDDFWYPSSLVISLTKFKPILKLLINHKKTNAGTAEMPLHILELGFEARDLLYDVVDEWKKEKENWAKSWMKSGVEKGEWNKNWFSLVVLGYIAMIFICLTFYLFPAAPTLSCCIWVRICSLPFLLLPIICSTPFGKDWSAKASTTVKFSSVLPYHSCPTHRHSMAFG